VAILVRERSFYKNLVALALPIILKNVITLSVGLADNLMVSSLGESALGGVFMSNQLSTFLQILVADAGTAVIVLASQYWGKRDTDSMKSIIGIGLKFSAILGLVAFTLGFFFTKQTLGLYTNEVSVIAEGAKYLKIVSVGYLFYCTTEILIVSMRTVESVRVGLYVSIVALLTNVTLNYVLIFGKLGFPSLGVSGAAIATLISRIAEFIVIFIYVRRVDKRLMLRIRSLIHTNPVLLRDFVRYGLPVIAGGVIWGMNTNVQGAIIGRLGEAAISSISVANIIFSIITVVVYGTRDACSVTIGKTVGTGNIDRVKLYAKTFQLIFITMGLISGALIFSARSVVPIIWQNLNPETLDMIKQFLLVLSVTSVGTSYQACSLTGIVRAGGATHFVFVNDTFWVWCVVLPSAFVAAFVFHAEPWLVFAFLKGDQIYKCFVAVVKVNRFKWIKTLTREPAAV